MIVVIVDAIGLFLSTLLMNHWGFRDPNPPLFFLWSVGAIVLSLKTLVDLYR